MIVYVINVGVKMRIRYSMRHVAVSVTYCPFCLSPQGTSCKAKLRGTQYTDTHIARIKRWRDMEMKVRNKL